MRFGLKTRIFAAYAIVLALGAVLATLVYIYGNDVLQASRTLVQRDIGDLKTVAELKLDIRRQETVLYAYYASGDRKRFLERFRQSDAACLAGLDAVGRIAGREEVVALRERYRRVQERARDLDAMLGAARVDWNRARSALLAVSRETGDINRTLDDIAGRIEARVAASGVRTEASVVMMQRGVIMLSASILLVSLFIGYYINAYLAEQVERRRLAMFAERNPNPVMRLSLAGDVIYANPSCGELLRELGADPAAPRALLPADLTVRLAALRLSGTRYQLWQYELGGHSLECGVHFLPDLEIFHAYLSDITKRKRAEGQLVFQAYHDAMTGLPNRRMFQEQIEHVLSASDRGAMHAAVFLFGLDRFKVIIDSLGHAIGDQLLKAVAARMAAMVGDCRELCRDATLYRFEGDLFAILVPGVRTSEMPIMLAERIIEAMRAPFYIQRRELFTTFSVGVAIFPLDGQDGLTLIRNADTAMQRVKREGGNGFQCYTQDMNARAAEWLAIENHLRHALELNELHLYYQPQIDVASGRVVGMEALLRWHHPERGVIMPADIVPLAEETGLILSIGKWILRTACAQAQAWRAQGFGPFTVAVNISARQFHQQDLPLLVEAVLEETGLAPDGLELEITEGVAMQDVEHTTKVLERLKRIGVKLSVDDFGTGLSSMSYLKRFPIDKLKVDQSFIRHLTTDENDAAITRAVITLGHALKLKVIAEGVETAEQLAQLRFDACDEYQGYLYSRPLPVPQFTEILQIAAGCAARETESHALSS